MTDAEFEQIINELHPDLIKVAGLAWEAGHLVRKMDPVAFAEMKSNYENYFDSDEEDVDETEE